MIKDIKKMDGNTEGEKTAWGHENKFLGEFLKGSVREKHLL